MYCPHYYERPIRHLFRGGVNANKNTVETGLGRGNTHPTRNQDAMEPELQILPAIVFLLLYQEHERRLRRPRPGTAPFIVRGPLGPKCMDEAHTRYPTRNGENTAGASDRNETGISGGKEGEAPQPDE
ncbi:hypothetical protein NDU88_001633 [Pleurodeles waltl]|uniref:Uncharacterized protein n=1 Tax=Pleurodeles waltl TaxID=8319 RepID=A0AAV7TJM5_PLEWA|nr:hypothetical protein NDU88_001633 [Pleurodeles waltl]